MPQNIKINPQAVPPTIQFNGSGASNPVTLSAEADGSLKFTSPDGLNFQIQSSGLLVMGSGNVTSGAQVNIFAASGRTALSVFGGGINPDLIQFRDNNSNVIATITSSGSFTGNASTATRLQTARLINSGSFDGTSDITIKSALYFPLIAGSGIQAISYDGTTSGILNIAQSGITVGMLQTPNITLGSTDVRLGSGVTFISGMVSVQSTYFRGTLSGDATTATRLITPRLINSGSFDGSANITITANTPQALIFGSGLSYSLDSFDGSVAKTASVASGGIISLMLANNAVVSGKIASGAVNRFSVSSGFIQSGVTGNAGIVSGNIASGAIGPNVIGQGVLTVDKFASGTLDTVGYKYPNNTRLTLQSGSPVQNVDISGSANVFLEQYEGNQVSLYNNVTGAWQIYTISGSTSLAASAASGGGFLAGTVRDIFAYAISGGVTSGRVAMDWGPPWTNYATRPTTGILNVLNGVYVQSGDFSRRYLGTAAILPSSGYGVWSGGTLSGTTYPSHLGVNNNLVNTLDRRLLYNVNTLPFNYNRFNPIPNGQTANTFYPWHAESSIYYVQGLDTQPVTFGGYTAIGPQAAGSVAGSIYPIVVSGFANISGYYQPVPVQAGQDWFTTTNFYCNLSTISYKPSIGLTSQYYRVFAAASAVNYSIYQKYIAGTIYV